MTIRHCLLLLSFVLVFSACDNPFVSTPGTQVKNIVTGIYITNETGETVGVWGNPSSTIQAVGKRTNSDNADEELNELPQSFSMGVPYPNPFKYSARVRFSLPQATRVNLWYETAYLPETQNPLPNQSSQRPFQRFYLVENFALNAGVHEVHFDTSLNEEGEDEERISPGFYRMYLQTGSFVVTHDFYVIGERNQAPIGLRDYIWY